MLDRIIIAPQQSDRLVPYEKTVVEKRAPTDESVRLLSEMEAAAMKRILSSWELADNDLNAQWHIEKDMCNNRMNVHLRYRLNGVERNMLIRVREEAEILPEIKKRLVDELALSLMQIINPRQISRN